MTFVPGLAQGVLLIVGLLKYENGLAALADRSTIGM